MSQHNPLAGLLGQYGSDEDSDSETPQKSVNAVNHQISSNQSTTAVHPPPVSHCPWSACYDSNSGYTYYWNQKTNEVTWQAPPDYLLALKLAEKKLHEASSTEVTAEEWQLYQQALAEKQAVQSNLATITDKVVANDKKPTNNKLEVKTNKNVVNGTSTKKRPPSDSEDEIKIEPITTYCRSDSDSNEESESRSQEKLLPAQPKPLKTKNPHKKHKVKHSKQVTLEYGPMLPPNQNYSVPIGPELPPELQVEIKAKTPEISPVDSPKQGNATPPVNEKDDEDMLLKKLRDKAKVLENLGGEIPSEIKKYIKEGNSSRGESPARSVASTTKLDTDIDDLLEEIEKKELPKIKTKIDSKSSSRINSPKTPDNGIQTPPLEVKPLFPSAHIGQVGLFPSAVNIDTTEEKIETTDKVKPELVLEKKGTNIYLMNEPIENVNKKKLRISNSVLPERKSEVPSYTTKYSQFIEGFAGERTGLGFSNNDGGNSPKQTVSYGKGLMFTKGEVLNEDKSEEMNEIVDTLEAKLKFLNQQQTYQVTPLQEMTVQLQTLQAAHDNNALTRSYYRRWLDAAVDALNKLEQSATPQGWTCRFNRSESRYEYVRDSDGLVQQEYPNEGDDMDISTTPPHPGIEEKLPAPSPPPPLPPLPPSPCHTPPPPVWEPAPPSQWGPDPPPPGCEPPLPEPHTESKKEITDELMSFYNDIAEIEKVTSPTPPSISRSSTPDTRELGPETIKMAESKMASEKPKHRHASEEKTVKEGKVKKKSKVKISSSVGLKHKTVSSLVAKWQQVAEEINSD